MWRRRLKLSRPPSRTTRSSPTSSARTGRGSDRPRRGSSRCSCDCASPSACRRSLCGTSRECSGWRWATTANGRPGRSRSPANGAGSRRRLRDSATASRRTRRSRGRTSRRRRITTWVSSACTRRPRARAQERRCSRRSAGGRPPTRCLPASTSTPGTLRASSSTCATASRCAARTTSRAPPSGASFVRTAAGLPGRPRTASLALD